MNVIICDDEPLYINTITETVTDWARHAGHTKAIVSKSYTSGEDLLEDFERGLKIDLLFMDIQIPGEMNGMAVAKAIHRQNEYIPIVFITNYAEYACEGYEVNALRFLRKPVSPKAVFECMDIVWRRWQYLDTDSIVFESGTQILRLPAVSIVYIEAAGHQLTVHVTGQEAPYILRQRLDHIKKLLPSSLFCQCHRGFIVNMMYIRRFSGNWLSLADGTEIPVGRVFHSAFVDQYRIFYLGE